MKKLLTTLGMCFLMAAPTFAQRDEDEPGDQPQRGRQLGQRDDQEGGRPGGGGFRGRRGGPPNPMFEAIDADNDGVITQRELRRAAAALKKLDADNDGQITLAEASPQFGPGGRGAFGQMLVDRFDANSDGKLSTDEIPEQLAARLQDADTNNDELLDAAEIDAAMQQGRGGRFGGGPGGGRFGGGGGADPQAMMERFMANDSNGDGMLTPNEVQGFMARMLQGGDANGDGAIDAGELRQIVERMGSQGRFGFGRQGGDGAPQGRFQRRGGDGDDQGGGLRGRRGDQ